ncbi:MAG: DUF3368 domain-containing protein [Anaerolineales bacterium]|nr:DUF3368 domain-containing protein [Anaerolineales bacterium]MCB9127392.1 DUF3368 domain-containing protein [Ardenticatenales bacterium]
MPDGERLVISNTTPIIALTLTNQLHLLRTLYGEVLIPTAVEAELLAGGVRAGAKEIRATDFIRAVDLTDPRRAALLSDLDRGEAEVIALALERDADLVIIDERLGRRHAKRLGLTITGVVGLLIKAKQLGHIAHVAPLIAQMRQRGIRFADALVAQALQMADEQE